MTALRSTLPAVLAATLLALACGCSQGDAIAGQSPTPAPSARPAPSISGTGTGTGEAMPAFARRIGVTCDEGGMSSCITGKIEVGDYLDVELRPGCGSQGVYAVVTGEGVELRDRAAPLDRRTVARLAAGQFLCVEAIGRAGEMPAYYYVSAESPIPASACESGPTCSTSPTTKILWVDPTIKDCAPSQLAAGQRRCAAGWIDAEAIALLETAKAKTP